MNSFWKGFFSLFDWIFPKSMEEQLNDLDNQMQDLYDRMGWGEYPYPNNNCSYITNRDVNRILEAEKSFMNEVYDYNTRQVITTIRQKIFYNKRDPARPRVNKYYV